MCWGWGGPSVILRGRHTTGTNTQQDQRVKGPNNETEGVLQGCFSRASCLLLACARRLPHVGRPPGGQLYPSGGCWPPALHGPGLLNLSWHPASGGDMTVTSLKCLPTLYSRRSAAGCVGSLPGPSSLQVLKWQTRALGPGSNLHTDLHLPGGFCFLKIELTASI